MIKDLSDLKDLIEGQDDYYSWMPSLNLEEQLASIFSKNKNAETAAIFFLENTIEGSVIIEQEIKSHWFNLKTNKSIER